MKPILLKYLNSQEESRLETDEDGIKQENINI